MASSRVSPGWLLPSLALAAAGAAAAVAFRLPRNAVDRRVRRALVARSTPAVRRAARALSPLGKPYGHGPLALAMAAYVSRETGCWRDGVPIIAASASAALASRLLERYLPVRHPPPGRHKPDEPSFPSGHALETAAVATAASIVLDRQELGRRALIVPAVILAPLLSGAAKLYLDRHWATDVVGGWAAGVALGAAIGHGLDRGA